MSSFTTNEPGARRWWLAAGAILLLSLYLHLVTAHDTRIYQPVRNDARDYIVYALNLDRYDVFSRTPAPGGVAPRPDALRAPGYPVFLSLLIDPSAPDLNLDRVIVAQALLGVLTVLLCLLLFRRVLAPGWALAATALTAISPHLVNSGAYFLSESLFTFLLALHLLCAERAWTLRSRGWLVAAGVVLALSILVRPTTQYLVVFYALALCSLRGLSPRARLGAVAVLLLPVVLASGLWGLRNLEQTGHFTDQTLQANFLQHGMYIDMMYDDDPKTRGYPYRADPQNAEIAGDTGKVLAALAGRALADPVRYAGWVLVGKPEQFFAWNLTESIGGPFVYPPLASPWLDNPLFKIIGAITRGIHVPLMLLAFAGAAIALYRRDTQPLAAMLAVVFVYFVVIHMAGAPFPRYSIPLRPVSYGLALFALAAGWQFLKSRTARPTP